MEVDLVVDIDITGSITVSGTISNAAALDINSGTTTVTGLTTNQSGGTLTINGDLTFASGSIYQVDVDTAGNSDLLIVTGQASLAGTLQVLAGPGEYSLRLVPFLASLTIYLGLRDHRMAHRKLARWTFPIWLYVSVTGVVIYFSVAAVLLRGTLL